MISQSWGFNHCEESLGRHILTTMSFLLKTQNCCFQGCVWTPVTYTHEDACYMCMSLRQPHHNKLVLFVILKSWRVTGKQFLLRFKLTVHCNINTDFRRKLRNHHKSLFKYICVGRYLGHCCWLSCSFCHRYFTQLSQAVSPWKCWHVICNAPLYLSSTKNPIQTLATSLRQHLDLILTQIHTSTTFHPQEHRFSCRGTWESTSSSKWESH